MATWRIERVTPSPRERSQLQAAGIWDPTVSSYLTWRRSALIVATPILGLSAALATWSFKDIETDLFNGLGVLAQILPLLGPIVLFLAALVSVTQWTNARTKVLVGAWVLSLALPLLPALMPFDWLVDRDELLVQMDFDPQAAAAFIGLAKVLLGVGYAVSLLPVIVTFPGGVVRGSLRVKGLLPHTGFAGWFLVTTAPFYSLIVLVALTLIVQFFGTGLLVLGAVCLALAPWIYVHQRAHFVGPSMDAEANAALDRSQKINSALTLSGIGFMLLWAFTAKIDGVSVVGTSGESPLQTLAVGRVAVETAGRMIVTTVVFAHVFLSMTITGRQLAAAEHSLRAEEEHDAKVNSLAEAFGMVTPPEQR